MVVKDGVDFDSLDGEPVYLIFLIAAPNTKDNVPPGCAEQTFHASYG